MICFIDSAGMLFCLLGAMPQLLSLIVDISGFRTIVQFGMLLIVLSNYTAEMRGHDLFTVCYLFLDGSNWIFVSKSLV